MVPVKLGCTCDCIRGLGIAGVGRVAALHVPGVVVAAHSGHRAKLLFPLEAILEVKGAARLCHVVLPAGFSADSTKSTVSSVGTSSAFTTGRRHATRGTITNAAAK